MVSISSTFMLDNEFLTLDKVHITCINNSSMSGEQQSSSGLIGTGELKLRGLEELAKPSMKPLSIPRYDPNAEPTRDYSRKPAGIVAAAKEHGLLRRLKELANKQGPPKPTNT